MNFRVGATVALALMICLRSTSQNLNCAPPRDTAEMFACAQQALSSAEREMEITLRKAVETYAPSAAELADESHMDKFDRAEAIRYRTAMKRQLRSSQIAWLSYRKAACLTVLAMYENGTAGPTAQLGCREALTRERTSHLREYYLQK
jgi:uncharacterized protein YecT (DUF1311 family)